MGNHHNKLLELLGINHDSSGYSLHIKISSENEHNTEILWAVDKYTAENLQLFAKFNEKFKYRLSFSNSWSATEKQYMGILSKTYLHQSERIHFPCSDDYIDKLQLIKHSKNIMDLDTDFFEPFETIDLTPIVQTEDIPFIKQIKFNMVSIISICIIVLLFFNYLNPIYLNSVEFDKDLFSQPVLLTQVPSTYGQAMKNTSGKQSSKVSPKDKAVYNQPVIYSVPKGRVALTFEGGPTRHSLDIMNVLNKYNVGGTFFFTGVHVNKYPDYVKSIYSNGYSIGSHGLNHINLSKLSYEEQDNQLVKSNKVIEDVINDNVVLFRPPYGAFNEDTKSLVNKYQYQMVHWNIDPEDWKTHNADEIFNHIKNSNPSGSIIILHETQAVLDALSRIIEHLEELELEIVSL